MGNAVRTCLHFDAEHLLVHFPVGVTHFDRVTNEVQRHFGDDGLVGVDDLKVDVRDGAPDGVTLDLAGHDRIGRAIGVHGDESIQTLLARDGRAELFRVH